MAGLRRPGPSAPQLLSPSAALLVALFSILAPLVSGFCPSSSLLGLRGLDLGLARHGFRGSALQPLSPSAPQLLSPSGFIIRRPGHAFPLRMQQNPEDNDKSSEKNKMITDKLAQWKKAAEDFRAADASSFFSRAAASAPNKPDLQSIMGSRGDALNRMWDLKEWERKAEIARDLQKYQEEEEGNQEERERLRQQVEEDIRQFAANNPTIDYATLEQEALRVRDPAAVTAKLNAWRQRSVVEEKERESQLEIGKVIFNLIASILYPVTFVIGLLTGRPVDLPELDLALYSEITKDIDYSRDKQLRKLEEESEIKLRLRKRWQDEAESFSFNQAMTRMEEMIQHDDGPAIRALLNDVVDNSKVYAALLGYGEDGETTETTSPFMMAAELGRMDAVQTLLAAGCKLESGEEAARANGHMDVAEMIQSWKSQRI